MKEEIKAHLRKAIYDGQVEMARQSIQAIPFEIDDLPSLFDRLREETETAQILIFGSYLEDRIRALIGARLHYVDTKKLEDSLFGSHGPFDTLGSRISISFHLGWLSRHQRDALIAFQKIRNDFAHRAFRISLMDSTIADRFSSIDYPIQEIFCTFRSVAEEHGVPEIIPLFENLTIQQRYLCKLIELARFTFVDFLVLPAAQTYKVDPSHIMNPAGKIGDIEALPGTIKQIEIAATNAVVQFIVKPEDRHLLV